MKDDSDAHGRADDGDRSEQPASNGQPDVQDGAGWLGSDGGIDEKAGAAIDETIRVTLGDAVPEDGEPSNGHDEVPLVSTDGADGDDGVGPPPEPAELDPKAEVETAVLDDVWAFFEEQRREHEAAAERATAEADALAGNRKLAARLRRRLGVDERLLPVVTPDETFVREEWFDFDYLDTYEEVERVWVTYPYAYVSILYDADERRYQYHVTEPQLSPFERYIRNDLTTALRNSLMYRDIDDERDRDAVFTEMMREVLHDHAAAVPDGTVVKLSYYYTRDFLGYGDIDPLMHDSAIEDISCDGENVPVYIYHRRYRDLRTNVSFDANTLNSTVVKLAQKSGKHISVSNPLVDASLPDGSRIQLTLGADVSTRGSNFTIRKFSEVPHTPVDLINWNTFSVEQMAYFWLAIENNMSLIFAGGTGSGKTTSMNAISLFIPPDSKIVSIEDTRELVLPHGNWVQSTTRESATATGEGDITTHNLLQAALRQRPEYLLVGEIRTEQRVALTFFQAIGTGHTAYSTFHADTVDAALARLQNPPLAVPAQMLQNLDIISIQRQVTRGKDRLRRTEAIHEIVADDGNDRITTRTVFERAPGADEHRKVADSSVLERIAYQQGWSADEVEAEYDNRREVLSYLVDEGITGFDDVTRLLETYSRAPEAVLDHVRSDNEDGDGSEELFVR